ncbi:hypothetical protein [uncultured Dokdonia sp.]|uniref:hypothetical protein n=1 Tax=uncultured Dokdonia sp. TaxID=575653 RepID=UPI002633DC7C|nr:hypothetical protein [uncultured Dokdonia sp.]
MKTLKLVPLFLIAFLFCNYSAVAQEDDDEFEEESSLTTVKAVYLGMVGDVYTFSYKDEDGVEDKMTFDKITDEVKKMYDLTTKALVGKTFELTFSTENVPDEDDEDILTSVNTIISLKQL